MRFSAYHENSVDCAKVKEFPFEDPFKDKKLSANTLMEGIKPTVMGKFEFEYKDMSKLIALLDYQDSDATIKIHISLLNSAQVDGYCLSLDGKIQSRSCGAM